MTRSQRLEARLSLAMLPVGLTLGLGSALGAAALLLFAVPALIMAITGNATWWIFGWCLGGGLALGWSAVTSIEVVSAFDWRPLPRVLLGIALAALASPFLW